MRGLEVLAASLYLSPTAPSPHHPIASTSLLISSSPPHLIASSIFPLPSLRTMQKIESATAATSRN